MRAIPGVVQTAYASVAPWSGRNSTEIVAIDGRPIPATRDSRRDPARRLVSPEYFATLGIPVTRGRVFTRDEASATQIVPAVISGAMARRYWPGADPIGHRFRVSAVYEVIGVCQDVQSITPMQDDGPFYYLPLDVRLSKAPALLVRVSGDAHGVAAIVGDMVRQMEPQLTTSSVVTLASIVERQGERLRPVMIFGAVAGVLALMLALTGVYGIVSFSVSQRIREIGIRLALGAQRQHVIFLVLRSGVAPVAVGLLVGVGLAVAVSSATSAILFGVNPRDPFVLVIVPLLLFAAAMGATWIPARRAAVLDPLTSLRSE